MRLATVTVAALACGMGWSTALGQSLPSPVSQGASLRWAGPLDELRPPASFAAASPGNSDLPIGQPLPPPVVAVQPVLTLADLEALAFGGNPTLPQAGAAIDQQRGVWVQAGLYPNPQMGYLRDDASRAEQSQTNGMFVSQEIVTAHKRQLARAVESQEVNRLGWEREAQRLRVRNDLHIRYYEVLGAQQAISQNETLLRVAEDGVRAAEEFRKANLGAKTDILQSRIQRNVVRASLADARFRHQAAWEQLCTVIGHPGLNPVHVAGSLEGPLPELDWDASLRRLYAESPQLRAAEVRLYHARAELRREQAAPIPNVTVQTVTQYDRVNQSTNLSTLLSIPVPLYNRNQGNIFHAAADIREAQTEIERVRLVLHDTLADSFRRYQIARNNVEQLRAEILPDAQENLKLTEQGYQAGEFDFLRVLTARQMYFQSHLAYLESLTELRKIVVEIEGLQLTGGLNPATLGAAIQSQGGFRQQGLLNQLHDSSTKQILPPAVQATAQ